MVRWEQQAALKSQVCDLEPEVTILVTNLRQGKIRLIDASREFEKGWPKNFIPDAAVEKIAAAYRAGVDVEKLVKVVSCEDVARNDYNLSPSRYVDTETAAEHRDIQEILDDLAVLDGHARQLDSELNGIFEELGYSWETNR